MFENVIGQTKVIASIREQIQHDELPRAILLCGPAYSGKLTAALEVARVLACTAHPPGEWGCTCPACVQHRRLTHPHLLITGSRYFVQDIAACAEAMRSSPMDATVYLFVRSVQKLIRRFDPILWEGEETRLSKVLGHLEAIGDAMEGIEPGTPVPEGSDLDARITRVIDAAAKIVASMSSDNIPIHVVRNISSWARLSSPERGKVAILENADRMHDGSRNALLKILEEPPDTVTFILLSANPAALPATIRSRVRPYAFPERSEDDGRTVLQKIFRDTSGRVHSIRQYIMQNALLSNTGFEALARRFLELVVANESAQPEQSLEAIAAEVASTAGRDGHRYFLEELIGACRRILLSVRGGETGVVLPLSVLEAWSREIARHQRYMETLNMRPETVLQSLCLAMKEHHAEVH